MQNAISTAALLTEASARAQGKLTTVQLLADGLRNAMKEIHGGEWRVQINHEAQAAMIVQVRDDEPIMKPDSGEAV